MNNMINKSSQKLTDSRKNVIDLLSKSKITKADLKILDKRGHKLFGKKLNELVNKLEGKERDDFLSKIDEIIEPETRNSLWEYNHVQIINQISEYFQNFARMPTQMELSQKTGLSRQTIHKHFKDYRNNPLYLEHLEQYRFMGQRVLGIMLKLAINGDVRAGRLYLDMVGGIMDDTPRVTHPRNYIQINNLILTQEEFAKLNALQISKIEEVLREALLIQETCDDKKGQRMAAL